MTVALSELPSTSRARLARVLEVRADVPVTATLVLDDGQGHQRTVQPPHSGTEIRTPVPGFRQGRTYAVTVTVSNLEGAPIHTEELQVTTSTIGGTWPELSLRSLVADPTRGDTIFPVRTESGGGALLMVDGEGELIWALDGGGSTWWRTVRVLEGGQLMLIADHDVILTDWGDLAPLAHPPPAGTEGYHHEAIPRPGGGFFAFTAGPLPVDDVPTDYSTACEPGQPTTIWDSIVVEADADGNPVQTWSLGERLDTHRLGWNSLDPTTVGPDLLHANGMQYLEADDAFLISMRNQDLVLKMSRSTGAIEWILSNPWGWNPDFEPLRLQPTDPNHRWNFHQHAPEWLDGKLLIHDNGAERDMPCGPEDAQTRRTRAVEYAIDESVGTVTEVWSWGTNLYSPIMGDADRVGPDRVLITYGQTTEDENGVSNTSRNRGQLSGRLIEVDRASGDVLWDLEIFEEDRQDNPGGYKVPRSQRLDGWW